MSLSDSESSDDGADERLNPSKESKKSNFVNFVVLMSGVNNCPTSQIGNCSKFTSLSIKETFCTSVKFFDCKGRK